MTYDAWKTRSPDDDIPDCDICPEHGYEEMYRRPGALFKICARCEAEERDQDRVPCEMCSGSKWKSACPECDGTGYYTLSSHHHNTGE